MATPEGSSLPLSSPPISEGDDAFEEAVEDLNEAEVEAEPTAFDGPSGSSYTYEYAPPKTILNDEILSSRRQRKKVYYGNITTISLSSHSGLNLAHHQAMSFASTQKKIHIDILSLDIAPNCILSPLSYCTSVRAETSRF
ncbi:hypothetical protein Vi05172_g11817 [Venturia inaequalis]|uniref:Uncharacterized protein n=1 Tax=Venturia inaequalis TaxID=5025 RepID=A0A8H3YVH5_VENIN|nr:hypothetical protein EG327_009872 [Venturia inaequalis]RDI78209.1 hypothetical protein Vi05172_g11817 [Venturia inaequalis]